MATKSRIASSLPSEYRGVSPSPLYEATGTEVVIYKIAPPSLSLSLSLSFPGVTDPRFSQQLRDNNGCSRSIDRSICYCCIWKLISFLTPTNLDLHSLTHCVFPHPNPTHHHHFVSRVPVLLSKPSPFHLPLYRPFISFSSLTCHSVYPALPSHSCLSLTAPSIQTLSSPPCLSLAAPFIQHVHLPLVSLSPLRLSEPFNLPLVSHLLLHLFKSSISLLSLPHRSVYPSPSISTLLSLTIPRLQFILSPSCLSLTALFIQLVDLSFFLSLTAPSIQAIPSPPWLSIATPSIQAVTSPSCLSLATPSIQAVTSPSCLSIATPSIQAVTSPSCLSLATPFIQAIPCPPCLSLTAPSIQALPSPTCLSLVTPFIHLFPPPWISHATLFPTPPLSTLAALSIALNKYLTSFSCYSSQDKCLSSYLRSQRIPSPPTSTLFYITSHLFTLPSSLPPANLFLSPFIFPPYISFIEVYSPKHALIIFSFPSPPRRLAKTYFLRASLSYFALPALSFLYLFFFIP
ncbi:unnamed protein product [Acanthosepion pharaonis]|uniref:Uncharacterized protein n=1 Tax=Acanthosepion pharaonis TaxID=158019 RepID=A0A812CWA1_ACAPH|nr:unnamed protein product [Sepia pharaonis]